MKECNIKITTDADGKQSVFTCKGEVEFSDEGVVVHYKNGESEVAFVVGAHPSMSHSGDYGLRFSFETGKTTMASMSIAGQTGEFPLKTKEFHYKITEKEIKAYIKYMLKFEGGYQSMKVNFTASIIQ